MRWIFVLLISMGFCLNFIYLKDFGYKEFALEHMKPIERVSCQEVNEALKKLVELADENGVCICFEISEDCNLKIPEGAIFSNNLIVYSKMGAFRLNESSLEMHMNEVTHICAKKENGKVLIGKSHRPETFKIQPKENKTGKRYFSIIEFIIYILNKILWLFGLE